MREQHKQSCDTEAMKKETKAEDKDPLKKGGDGDKAKDSVAPGALAVGIRSTVVGSGAEKPIKEDDYLLRTSRTEMGLAGTVWENTGIMASPPEPLPHDDDYSEAPSLGRASVATSRSIPGAYDNQPGVVVPTRRSSVDRNLLGSSGSTNNLAAATDVVDGGAREGGEALVEARAVDSDEETGRPTAVAVEGNDDGNEEKGGTMQKLRNGCRRILAVACLVLVLVGTIIAVFDWRQASNDSQAPDPSVVPEPLSLEEELLEEALPVRSISAAKNDPSSPQARAWSWMAEDPSLMQYSQRRVRQRFALGTIYYALNNPNPSNQTAPGARPWFQDTHWLDYEVHECEWYSRSTDTILRRPRPETSPCAGSKEEWGGQWYTHLWLGNNSLVGTLPIHEVCLLASLESLVMAFNNIHGTLFDPCLLELSNLREIDFHSRRDWILKNELTGTIMTEIGLMTNLKDLILGNVGNNLEGTVPSQIGLLSNNLNALGLSNNRLLNGTIPSELFGLANLTILGLSGTGITGTLPTEMGLLTNLMLTYLWRGRLSGTLPTELGALQRLSWFHAYNNQFSGPIPSELGSMPLLREIRLSNNALTSTIPSELGNAPSLNRLEASNNQLTGTLSSELGRLELLRILALNNNQLSGSLPSQLGNLGSAEVVDLSHNTIEGSLPTQLGSLAAVEKLLLNDNAVSMQLPTQLGLLSALQELDLSQNDLSGSMPPLPNLVRFNVSSNPLLSGEIPNN